MKKTTENKKTTNSREIVGTFTLKKAFIGSTKYDDEEKARITLYNAEFDYSQITAYDETPAKMIPSWYKDAEGYINLSSKYDIDVLTPDGRRIVFRDLIEEGEALHDAKVVAKMIQKDGAVYPLALKILEYGEERDPFENM